MWWAVVGAAFLFMFSQLQQRNRPASIQIPFTEWMPGVRPSFAFRALSFLFNIGAFLFLTAAFVDCTVGSGPLERYLWSSPLAIPPPTAAESRLLFFVIDHSGSMAEPMPDNPQTSKMAVVKEGLQNCITSIDQRGGQNDFMGLVTFARAARIDVPLSRDRLFLKGMIQKMVPETVDRLNGTAIGYAIFKSVALLAACRSFAAEQSKNDTSPLVGNSIILITDGLEEPNPADRSNPFRSIRTMQALDYAKENHVKVNYINVDKYSYQQLAPEERDRLLQAVESTGGQYFEITINQTLSQALEKITKSIEQQQAAPPQENRLELSFWLILLALLCSSVSRLLETVLARVVR
jgi:Ca-activated chloride channel homolog